MITEQRKIQHLQWRFGFGPGIGNAGYETLKKAKKALLNDSQKTTPIAVVEPFGFDNFKQMQEAADATKQMIRKAAAQKKKEVNVAWLAQMATGKAALRNRMTLFWHDHFACRPNFGSFAQQYINTLHQHALGNFRDLVIAIAKDPAMLRFLNNQQNRKKSPNENFARELMELFTLGIGEYIEEDIKEAARAFTGWKSNLKGEFLFVKGQHDFGSKTFLGKTGNFDGEDIIDIILAKPECAQFIARKVYAYFVNDQVDEKKAQQLGNTFYKSGYNIETLVTEIITSSWFYEEQNIGSKIKSPIDLLVGLIKTFDIQFGNPYAPMFIQRILGELLLVPPSVAGWPGGQSWIDSSTLVFRLRMAERIFSNAEFTTSAKDEAEVALGKKPGRYSATINVSTLFKQLDRTGNFEKGAISFLVQTEVSDTFPGNISLTKTPEKS